MVEHFGKIIISQMGVYWAPAQVQTACLRLAFVSSVSIHVDVTDGTTFLVAHGWHLAKGTTLSGMCRVFFSPRLKDKLPEECVWFEVASTSAWSQFSYFFYSVSVKWTRRPGRGKKKIMLTLCFNARFNDFFLSFISCSGAFNSEQYTVQTSFPEVNKDEREIHLTGF